MTFRPRAALPLALSLSLLYATSATAAGWSIPGQANPLLLQIKDNGGGHGGGNGGGHGNGGGGNSGGNGNGGNAGNGNDGGLGKGQGKTAAVSTGDDPTDVEIGLDGSPVIGNGAFHNHGQRVSSMVALSKSLGYGARVGAMQANFGTPQETGIRALQERIATLEADPTTDPAVIDALKAELADRIAAVKPGTGPTGSWEAVNLDVDGNGVVDDHDLTLAREGYRPAE